MSVYRIGETQAKPETIEALRDFLTGIIPMILSSQGCESVQLFQNEDDPTRFIMIESWDSTESHRAAAKNIPLELLSQIRPLLGAAPSGNYFHQVAQDSK